MATKLRDRGNLSADQQAKIRSMLAEGKTPADIANEMHYLPKYLDGRIAKHGLDKPSSGGAPAAVKPVAKPKTAKAKPGPKPSTTKAPVETVESILEGVPPGLRADIAGLVVARLKSDFKIEIKPENANKAIPLYYEIVGRLEELKTL